METFPEQNQSHLAAGSGLYCRIFTAGVCGIRPTGFDSSTAIPRFPKAWPAIRLRIWAASEATHPASVAPDYRMAG